MEPKTNRQKLPVRYNRCGPTGSVNPSVAVVKTPQHLKFLPAKRNILGQCLVNGATGNDGSSQSKTPSKIALPINNARTRPLVVANANQNFNKASPLVPLEEYEKHHEGAANVGIFKDFEKFRTLPAMHKAQFRNVHSAKKQSIGRTTQHNRKSEYTYQKKVTYKENRPIVKNLIPVPSSPLFLYGVRKVRKSDFDSATRAALLSAKKGSELASESSILGDRSLGMTLIPFNPMSTYCNPEPHLQPRETRTQSKQRNETFTTADQLPADDGNKPLQPRDYAEQIANQAAASTSCESTLPAEQNSPPNCDVRSPRSCVDPRLDFELKQLSLLQELHELQARQSDCLKKMLNIQQQKINFLQGENTSSTQVKFDIAGGVLASTVPEIIIESVSPTPKRRRSARLQMQSGCDQVGAESMATSSSVFNIYEQRSMSKDNNSSVNVGLLPVSMNSSAKKRATRRKSVVEQFGGLRSSFKHLLQTPKETPCPGTTSKSGKKVQFQVQDTPSRITSTVMKQLNHLYDS